MIEVFIGIVFRAVGRQGKEFNFLHMCFDPFTYLCCMMNSKVIDNQKDFAGSIFDEAPEELEKRVGGNTRYWDNDQT